MAEDLSAKTSVVTTDLATAQSCAVPGDDIRGAVEGALGNVPSGATAQTNAECDHCGTCWYHGDVATAQSVGFLTEDERRFFAYMAEQRFRSVVEKDPEKRDLQRERWRQVALWFVPDWGGTQGV